MLAGSRPIFSPSKLCKHAMTRFYLKQLLRIYNLAKTKTRAQQMKEILIMQIINCLPNWLINWTKWLLGRGVK